MVKSRANKAADVPPNSFSSRGVRVIQRFFAPIVVIWGANEKVLGFAMMSGIVRDV